MSQTKKSVIKIYFRFLLGMLASGTISLIDKIKGGTLGNVP